MVGDRTFTEGGGGVLPRRHGTLCPGLSIQSDNNPGGKSRLSWRRCPVILREKCQEVNGKCHRAWGKQKVIGKSSIHLVMGAGNAGTWQRKSLADPHYRAKKALRLLGWLRGLGETQKAMLDKGEWKELSNN